MEIKYEIELVKFFIKRNIRGGNNLCGLDKEGTEFALVHSAMCAEGGGTMVWVEKSTSWYFNDTKPPEKGSEKE